MSNNPTLIAGFEDFLSYIRNQDAIIKTLKKQAEEHKEADEQIQKLNKELVALKDAEIEKLKEEIAHKKQLKEKLTTLSGQYELAIQDIKQGEEEIAKLKEESSDEAQEAIKNLCANWYDDEKRNYGECYESEEEDEDNIATADLKEHNYKDLRIIIDWFKKDNQKDAEIAKLKKEVEEQREEIWYSTLLTAEVIQNQCPEELKHLCTDEKAQKICDKYKAGIATYLYQVMDDTCEADIDYEEELADKYDGDDWGWVYGKNIVEQKEYKEVVLVMSGGGDHWENYTMTPTMNYIVNKDGKHPQRDKKFLVQSSCGKYVSFQDKDYVPDEDECICEYDDCVVE